MGKAEKQEHRPEGQGQRQSERLKESAGEVGPDEPADEFGRILTEMGGPLPNRQTNKASISMMKWEYRVEPISFADIAVASKAVNGWGREGWEIVGIVPKIAGQDATWTVALLKRQDSNSA